MNIPFEDKYPAHTDGGFDAVNEEPEVIAHLLKGKHFKRSASIISAGEVMLFNILPNSGEVVGIDHAYRSIAATYMKILLLLEMGPQGVKKFWLDNHVLDEKLKERLDALKERMPEGLRQHVNMNPPPPKPGSYTYYSAVTPISSVTSIRMEWGLVAVRTLRKVLARLEKLTLIHGDLRDLKERGEFDLLYTSNAHDHTTRDKRRLDVKELIPLVRKGGHVLLSGVNKWPVDQFKEVKFVRGYRNHQWEYRLLQRTA